MVCWNVAVVRAEIRSEAARELLLGGQTVLLVWAGMLEQVLGRRPSVTVTEGGQAATLWTPDIVIRVADGAISAQATGSRWTGTDIQRITEQVTEQAKALGVPLAVERTVQGIAARYGQYAVVGDRQVGPNRVVKVRIPL